MEKYSFFQYNGNDSVDWEEKEPVKDELSADYIVEKLKERGIPLAVQVEKKVDSTNNVLKSYAAMGESRDLVLLSEEQSAGRGRRGRSFFSPEGTGIYLSLLLHPDVTPKESAILTTLTAAAAAVAIEAVTGVETQIKWVNDVFVRGKKIAGILTEASLVPGKSAPEYVVVGIGLNLYMPEQGFPEELQEVAGSILESSEHLNNLRNRLATEFLISFMEYYRTFPDRSYLEEYRKRCFAIGRRVRILEPEGALEKSAQRASLGREYATVLGIDEDCHLQVQYDDGTRELLSGGEISIRL